MMRELRRGIKVKKILILYYSRTGNTEKMANAIEDGSARAIELDWKNAENLE